MVAFLVAKKVKSPWVFTIQKTKKKRKLELCWLMFLLVIVRISENWLDCLDCFECLLFFGLEDSLDCWLIQAFKD